MRLLASLHDDDGEVAVAGLKSGGAADLDYDEARLREESGLLDGVSTIGSGSLLSRIWTKPSITTIGIDAPSVATSSNTLVPSAAREDLDAAGARRGRPWTPSRCCATTSSSTPRGAPRSR